MATRLNRKERHVLQSEKTYSSNSRKSVDIGTNLPPEPALPGPGKGLRDGFPGRVISGSSKPNTGLLGPQAEAWEGS